MLEPAPSAAAIVDDLLNALRQLPAAVPTAGGYRGLRSTIGQGCRWGENPSRQQGGGGLVLRGPANVSRVELIGWE